MATRGRKPLPSNVVRLRGNPSKLSKDELARRAAAPKAKKVLTTEHVQGLKRPNAQQKEILIDLLEAMPNGVWSTADLPPLLTLAGAMASWLDANDKITPETLVVKTKRGGLMSNPFLRIRDQQSLLILRAAAELGCSPAARVRMSVKPDDSDPFKVDPWAEFSNG